MSRPPVSDWMKYSSGTSGSSPLTKERKSKSITYIVHVFHGSITVRNDLTAPLRLLPTCASLLPPSDHSLSVHRSLLLNRPRACERRRGLLRHSASGRAPVGLGWSGVLPFIYSIRAVRLLLLSPYIASFALLSRAESSCNAQPSATFTRAT